MRIPAKFAATTSAFLLLGVFVSAQPSGGSRPAAAPYRASDSTVRVEHDTELLDSYLVDVQGRRVGEKGCTYSIHVRVEPEDVRPGYALGQRIYSVNYDTCEIVLERGQRRSSTTEDAPDPTEGADGYRSEFVEGEEQSEPEQPPVEPVAPNSLSQRPQATLPDRRETSAGPSLRSRAQFRVWWEDPPGLEVTVIKPLLEWGHDGVYAVRRTGGTFYSWLEQSGWQKDHSYTYHGENLYAVTQGGDANFSNNVFCSFLGGPPTYSVYENVQITGLPTGGVIIDWDDNYVDGGCTNLLSDEWDLGWVFVALPK